MLGRWSHAPVFGWEPNSDQIAATDADRGARFTCVSAAQPLVATINSSPGVFRTVAAGYRPVFTSPNNRPANRQGRGPGPADR